VNHFSNFLNVKKINPNPFAIFGALGYNLKAGKNPIAAKWGPIEISEVGDEGQDPVD
jgi:hypothetical protein